MKFFKRKSPLQKIVEAVTALNKKYPNTRFIEIRVETSAFNDMCYDEYESIGMGIDIRIGKTWARIVPWDQAPLRGVD